MSDYNYRYEMELEPDPFRLIGSSRRRSKKHRTCDMCGGKIEPGMMYDRLCLKDTDSKDGKQVVTVIRHNSWCHEYPVMVTNDV